MALIDLYDTDKRFRRQLDLLEQSNIPERTKELLREFIEDAPHGYGTEKISRGRAYKLLSHLRHMAEMLHEKEYDFEYLTEKELKYLLRRIDDHFYKIKKKKGRGPDKPGWGEHDYRRALLKFMKWLRNEHGYP